MRGGSGRLAELDGILADEPVLEDIVAIAAAWERACGVSEWSTVAGVVGACAPDGVTGVIIDGELDTKRQAGWEAVCADVPLEGGIGARLPGTALVPHGTGRRRCRIGRGGQGAGRREHEGCKPRWWVVGSGNAG